MGESLLTPLLIEGVILRLMEIQMKIEYKKNPHGRYALYRKPNSEVWRESASITNDQIIGDEYARTDDHEEIPESIPT